jgi:single-stranded DNA-binding protein
MNLNEETIYLHGNLGREWTQKQIESTGKKVLENAMAYQPTKDSPTTWIDLTVWENDDGDISHFKPIQDQSSKGTRVIVRGRFKSRDYQGKDGAWKKGWNCYIWDIATVIRNNKRSSWETGQTVKEGMPESKKRELEQMAGFDPDEPPF